MTQTSAHPGTLGEVSMDGKLKELWMEIGGTCHLRCDYCFANSGGIDRNPENLSLPKTLSTLEEFKQLGGRYLGIVGAGEPFHARNIEDLFAVLDTTKDLERVTVFTTGDLITDKTIDRLDKYPNTRLLIKYNSSNPEVQDRIVHSKGYTERRAQALERLISRGYASGQNGRLGIVTSIFPENLDEMPDLLRYARQNNLIFDADTVLPEGRGESCAKSNSDKIREVLKRLQEVDASEFGNIWEITGSYIASPPCTRFSSHLYMNKTGRVQPCVGSQKVELGNVKTQTLAEIWNSPIAKIIREHNYTGKCTTCRNYQEHKCFSCLGRATEDLSTESLERDKAVHTIGCFNYKE